MQDQNLTGKLMGKVWETCGVLERWDKVEGLCPSQVFSQRDAGEERQRKGWRTREENQKEQARHGSHDF